MDSLRIFVFSVAFLRLLATPISAATPPPVDDFSTNLSSTLLPSAIAAFLYPSPVAIFNATSLSVSSFATQITFATNSTDGTLAFAVIPTPDLPEGLATARAALSIEFDFTSGGLSSNENNAQYGRGAGPERFSFVEEYVKNQSIPYLGSWFFGSWKYPYPDSTTSSSRCTSLDQASPTSFAFDLIIAYEADSKQILVGSTICARPQIQRVDHFDATDLSDGLFSDNPYVGLLANGTSDFQILSWNFSVNASSYIESLTVEASESYDEGGGDGRNLSLGAKIGIAVGAALLGAALLAACALCVCAVSKRRRSAAERSVAMNGASAAYAARAGGGGRNGVVLEIQKPVRFSVPAPPPPPPPQELVGERDTEPLTRNASYASTTAASWLPSVAPR